MTIDTALTAALELAYLGLFVSAFREYLRHRDRLRRSVAGLFLVITLVFSLGTIGALVPAVARITGLAVFVTLVAMPVVTLFLVREFRPMSRWVLRIAFALLIAFTVIAVAITFHLDLGLGQTGSLVVVLLALADFIALELLAALLFGLESRRRTGASSLRLAAAAAATAGLAVAAIVLVTGGLATRSNVEAAAAVNFIVRLVALFSALTYLLAFVPPRRLRRQGQLGTTYDFIRSLNAIPADAPVQGIWELLANTAQRATGARSAAVVMEGEPAQRITVGPLPEEASGGSRPARLLHVPIRAGDRTAGSIELAVEGNPLFVDDDLELLELLASRAQLAAERAASVIERDRLIGELQAASAAKSDFLAAMSHELRTPLNAIIGFSELLLRPPETGQDEATVAEFSGHIHESGLHLLSLINEVLDLAKVEAGRLDLRPTTFDLDALVRSCLETLRPLADRKGITIGLVSSGRLELDADQGRIRQIVFNLVSNAIKFTPEAGAVELNLAMRDGAAALVVADTGPGIAAEDQETVFEAFRQAGGSHEGTGLGLALARQLVEAHAGRIELESEVGRGSRFTMILPITPHADHRLPLAAPDLADDRPTILAIEDDLAAAELLRVYLGEAGYNLAIAPDGRTGIEWATSLRPVAIVLDILLPDLDGWEVLRRLKAQDATRSVPVVVVSVLDDAPLGLALGAVDYFVKPVSREALLGSLGRLTFTTKVRTGTVTVLVIDADQDAGRYRELLEPDGFRVLVADTGASGLDQARSARPDLILLSLILPDTDGPDLVARLDADPATSTIPLWVTTPSTLSEDDKARLNGRVQHVVQRGDAALDALRGWLDQVGATNGPR